MNAVRIDPTMESLCFALERLRQDYQSVLQELADAKLQIAQLTLAAQMNHDTIVNRHVCTCCDNCGGKLIDGICARCDQ